MKYPKSYRECKRGNMKNLCLLLACLTFVSVMPSYAMKIIVNNENDRIVYSRSSFPHDEVSFSDEEVEQVKVKSSYYKSSSQNPEYYEYQLRLLGNDFRKELAGTKWNLVDDVENVPVASELEPQLTEYQMNLERLKRGSREAADYYMVDMMKDPNNLVPSGYLE